MKTDKLEICVDTENLVSLVFDARKEMTNADKRDYGAELTSRAVGLFSHIAMANNLIDERVKHINSFIAEFETVKILFRVGINKGIIQYRFRVPFAEVLTE